MRPQALRKLGSFVAQIDTRVSTSRERVRHDLARWFSTGLPSAGGALCYLTGRFDDVVERAGSDNFYASETRLCDILSPILRSSVPRGLSYVDLGPGTAASMLSRTVPLLSVLRPACYIPVDIVRAHLDSASRIVADRVPGPSVWPIEADFLTGELGLEPSLDRLVVMLGSTLSNLASADPSVTPWSAYETLFARLREMAGSAGFLLLGWHAAADAQAALAPYRSASQANFFRSALELAVEQFGARGLDPAAWDYRPTWYEPSRCVAHHLVARERQTVDFDGATYRFEPGHRLTAMLSYKLGRRDVLRLARAAGFDVQASAAAIDETSLFLFHVKK